MEKREFAMLTNRLGNFVGFGMGPYRFSRRGRVSWKARWFVGLLSGLVAGLGLASCAFRPVGIPLDETKILSSQRHLSEPPEGHELRVEISPQGLDGRFLSAQALDVGRCAVWKISRTQVVSTTAYRRRHLPAKAWGWVSAVTGLGLSALGIGLMAVNTEGMKGTKDDVDSDIQRRRFIGGIWSLLSGLGLAAMGVTWIALDGEKTVVEKGPVHRIRERQGTQDCQVRPLAGTPLQVSLGDSDLWRPVTTDGQGRFRMDLLDLLLHSSLAMVPRTLVFRTKGKVRRLELSDHVAAGSADGRPRPGARLAVIHFNDRPRLVRVELDDRVYLPLSHLLTSDEIDLQAGRKQWRIFLGGKGQPLVTRALLNCQKHLDLHVTVSASTGPTAPRPGDGADAEGPGRKAGRRARRTRRRAAPAATGAERQGRVVGLAVDGMGATSKLAVGATQTLFCGPEATPRLRLAAVDGRSVTYVVHIDASPNRPSGNVLRRQGRLLALDKGTADRLLVGRHGQLLLSGKPVGAFSIVEVTRDHCAARLEADPPADLPDKGLTYRLDD